MLRLFTKPRLFRSSIPPPRLTTTTTTTRHYVKAMSDHTSIKPDCPKPEYDTGCTYCMPDPELFERPTKPMPPVPFHSKHVVIHTNHTNWPSKLNNEENSLAAAITSPIQFEGKPVLVTNTDLPCGTHPAVTILPDNIHIPEIPVNQVEQLTSAIESNFEWNPLPHVQRKNPMILVCGHGARDKRCGVVGPMIVSELEKVLAKEGLLYHETKNPDGVLIGQCSHVGGHVFAGNLIYHDGKGSDPLWYSCVFPHHIQGVVKKTIIEGQRIDSLARK